MSFRSGPPRRLEDLPAGHGPGTVSPGFDRPAAFKGSLTGDQERVSRLSQELSKLLVEEDKDRDARSRSSHDSRSGSLRSTPFITPEGSFNKAYSPVHTHQSGNSSPEMRSPVRSAAVTRVHSGASKASTTSTSRTSSGESPVSNNAHKMAVREMDRKNREGGESGRDAGSYSRTPYQERVQYRQVI